MKTCVCVQEAKDLGLVLDVVEPDQLMAAATDLARRIAGVCVCDCQSWLQVAMCTAGGVSLCLSDTQDVTRQRSL